jgi:hypothetical protein
VSKLDDELRAKQMAAATDAVANVLRRLVADRPDLRVTQLTRAGLAILAEEAVTACILEAARQRKEYGSTLLDGDSILG